MQGLVVATLLLFVGAILAGVTTVQPRNYDFYEYNLTQMRKEFEKIVSYKLRWMKIANWIFFGGTALLATLIGVLILSA
jgi:uncharacterized membrane protein